MTEQPISLAELPNAGSPAGITPKKPSVRFRFIDGLRGLAAIMVVLSHFTVAGVGETDPFIAKLPKFVVGALGRGSFGVEIFFVISGFVIAYSQRAARVTPKYFLNFIIRRSLRLDPPYWVTLALAVGISLLANRFVHNRVEPIPTLKELGEHLLYLQEMLRIHNIVGATWTLCQEVQFYLVFTLVRGLSQLTGRASNLVESLTLTLLAVVSMGMYFGWIRDVFYGFFLHWWFMFFLGVTLWWLVESPKRQAWFYVTVILLTVAIILRFNEPAIVALASGLAVLLAALTGNLERWLSGKVLQFLGRISYSLYLIHSVIGERIIGIGERITGRNFSSKLLWVTVAIAAAIAAAALMNRFIEQPGIRLGKRLKE